MSDTVHIPPELLRVLSSSTIDHDTRTRVGYDTVKRLLDVSVIIVALPAIIIIGLLTAVLVAMTLGRPILFLQDRVGKDGKIFKLIKFRTMRPVDPASGLGNTDASRMTRVGQFIRLSHLDEIPQLWNILLGQMSLVGPRPEQVHLVEYYRSVLPNYDLRHSVLPGLTGLSQVYFGYARNVEETAEKLVYDLEYVRCYGLSIDARIILRTFAVYLNPKFVN
jgi:lipopolysaccharide/colanic/teichoic acid biosynthesis glycosyltransferase